MAFPEEGKLWSEVHFILEALQYDTTDTRNSFLTEILAAIPTHVQCQMLLSVAEKISDKLEQCRLLLLAMRKFPNLVKEHGLKLVETLIAAEAHHQTPVNCFQKLLICDVLPLVLQKGRGVKLHSLSLYQWLQKAVEFYISYVTQPPSLEPLTPLSPDLLSPTKMSRRVNIPGLHDKECQITDPWGSLFRILVLIGQHLHWDIEMEFFRKSREFQWQHILSLYNRSNQPGTDSHNKQILYTTCVLFLECLYHYISSVDMEGAFQDAVRHLQNYTVQGCKSKLQIRHSLQLACCYYSLSNYTAKNLFTAPLEVLLKLDSFIVQIDSTDDKLLISTATRCYLCDTLKEQYTQIGEKLRNGQFGACFLKQGSAAPTIYCARPGSRIWEVDFAGVVLNTHQFKELLAVAPLPVVTQGSMFDAPSTSQRFPAQGIAFPKLNILRTTMLVGWTSTCIYVLDPVNIKVILWCNAFSGIQDMCCLGNELYIFLQTMKIHCLSLSSAFDAISLCLKSENIVSAANMCIYFETIFLHRHTQKPITITDLYHLSDKLSDSNRTDLANKLNSVIVAMETINASASETESVASSRSRSGSSISRQSGDTLSLVAMETVDAGDAVINDSNRDTTEHIDRVNQESVHTDSSTMVDDISRTNTTVANDENSFAALERIAILDEMSSVVFDSDNTENTGVDIPDGGATQINSLGRGVPDGNSFVEPSSIASELGDTQCRRNEIQTYVSSNEHLPNSERSEHTNVEHINVELTGIASGEYRRGKCDSIGLDSIVEGNHPGVRETIVAMNTECVQTDEHHNMDTQTGDAAGDCKSSNKSPKESKELINEATGEVLDNVSCSDIVSSQAEMIATKEDELIAAVPNRELSVDKFETVNLDIVNGVGTVDEEIEELLHTETLLGESVMKTNNTSVDGKLVNEVVFKIGDDNPDIVKELDNHMTLNLKSSQGEIKAEATDSDVVQDKNRQLLAVSPIIYDRSPSPISPSPITMKHGNDVTVDGDLDLEFYHSLDLGARRPSLTSLSSFDSADINMEQTSWNGKLWLNHNGGENSTTAIHGKTENYPLCGDALADGSEEIAKPVRRKSSRKKHRRSWDDHRAGKKSERSYRRSYSVGAIQPLGGAPTKHSSASTPGTIEEDCLTVSSASTDKLEKHTATQSVAKQFGSENRSVPNLPEFGKKEDGHESSSSSGILAVLADVTLEESGDFGRSTEISPSQSPLSASWDGHREIGTSPGSRSTLTQLKNRVKTTVKTQTKQLVRNLKDKNLLSRAKEFAGNRPQNQDPVAEGPDWLTNSEADSHDTDSSKPPLTLGIAPLRLVDIEKLKEVISATERKLQDLTVLMNPETVYDTLLDWVTALNETFHKLHSIKYKSDSNLDGEMANGNYGEQVVRNEACDVDNVFVADSGEIIDKSTTDNRPQLKPAKEDSIGLDEGLPIKTEDNSSMVAADKLFGAQSDFLDILNDQDFCYIKDPIILPTDVFRDVSELAQACFDIGCHGNILKYRYCGNLQSAQNNFQCDSFMDRLGDKSSMAKSCAIEICDSLNVENKDTCTDTCDHDTVADADLSITTTITPSDNGFDADCARNLLTSFENDGIDIIDNSQNLAVLSETTGDSALQLSSSQNSIQFTDSQNVTIPVMTNVFAANTQEFVIEETATCIDNGQTLIALDEVETKHSPQFEGLNADKEAVPMSNNKQIDSPVITNHDFNASQQEQEKQSSGEIVTVVEDHDSHGGTMGHNHVPDSYVMANSEQQTTRDNIIQSTETLKTEHSSESMDNDQKETKTREQQVRTDKQPAEYVDNEDAAMSFYVRCYFPYLSAARIREWTLANKDGAGRYHTWCALLACMEAVVSEDGEKYGVDDASLISHVLDSCSADDNGSRLLGLVSRMFPSSRKIIEVCVKCYPYIVPLDVLYLCKYHQVAMETVFKQYMLQMIEGALRIHRKDMLSTLYVNDEVRHTWLELLLAEHLECPVDERGTPGAIVHTVQWTNGSKIDSILDLQMSHSTATRMLECCQKHGYWKGSLRLLKLLGKPRDHISLILQLGDITLLDDNDPCGYLPKNVTEWEQFLEAFVTYQKSRNQSNTQLQPDWSGHITWESIALLLVHHVGPHRAVSLLQSCDVSDESLSASFYQKCLLMGIVQRHQRLVLHSMLVKIDSYLWSQRPGVLSPQLHYAVAKEKQLQTTSEPSNSQQESLAALCSRLRSEASSGAQQYVEDPECHWGVTTSINTLCPCCGIALKDPVSHIESGVLLFLCGHGFHKLCLQDRECILCTSDTEMDLSSVKTAFI